MISQRTQQILDRLERHNAHPLTPAIKDAVIQAHTAAEAFAAKKAELASSGTLTPRGQHQALRDSLVHDYGKALARSRDPIRKAQREIKTRREALKVAAVDRTDVVGALDRQEIRSWLRTLDEGALVSLARTTSDKRILTAMIQAPPELSGLHKVKEAEYVAAEVERRYLEAQYPEELAALEDMQAVVDEGEAAIGVAQILMQSASELEDHQFEGLMRPIEQKIGAPWLLKNTRGLGADQVEIIQVVEVGADGKGSYRDATATDIANGVYYSDFNAFKTAQGLAA